MKVVVIGAGMGGLAVAVRLAAAGHQVVVLERSPVVGGKVATLELEGFRFDLGPAVLTLPGVWDDVFRVAGTALADQVELVALDPQLRCRWTDGSTLDVPDDESEWRTALERFSPGSSAEWQQFATTAERVWGAMAATHLAGPVPDGVPGLRRLRPRVDLGALEGKRTLAKLVAEHVSDPRLRQLLGRFATSAGASPYRAPGTFAGLAHVERTHGVWHVVGGVGHLRDSLERTARGIGVDIRCDTDVGRIAVEADRVSGVELADGGRVDADIVVANVDAAHLHTELLPDPRRARDLAKAGRSMSGFLMCAGVRGRTEGIAHQNVWFALDDRAEFERLEHGQLALDPTITVVVSSVTDPTAAPRDCENWYLLVHTPPAVGVDRKMMTASVLNRLAERGYDLRHRIEFTRTLIPADFDVRYRAQGGSFHGSSSDDSKSALQRPGNVGPVDGLYLVGGSAHPGGGLGMVASGARIVADLVAERGV
jgi:phytoene desaturase